MPQQLERTNGIVRQQTGIGHRRQNKFGKNWELSSSDGKVAGELFQLDLGSPVARKIVQLHWAELALAE
ncbi:hypothetical protein D5R40_12915 [Okeania hirsuta]|uniref:Uncharacterized protein n=1 Tax=Okeania hirsuta TaxID=1458930 RepID=A0A3N6RHL1_9CYAN|nr:hypothetical protein D5R40_12915 [Okeania hirsuta]